jgi:redox-sensitive bicupin YhaK (pirin superfamily)
MDKIRQIKEIIEPKMVIEGEGVLLRRSFGPTRNNYYDPFILFDHFAFNEPGESQPAGFPTHPHRGIDTVTYMLDGNVRHRDSLGNAGVIGPGDVQWMTSGRGILHEEMPIPGPSGNIKGFQLWVNLPASQKMSKPRYQEVAAETIPVYKCEGVVVRVVAGKYHGIVGPVTEIAAQPIYLDITLDPGVEIKLPIAESHSAIVYVFEGRGFFENSDREAREAIDALRMAVFDDGDFINVEAIGEQSLRFMLMSGRPFGEPIVPYGPFVMNTEAQIKKAFEDLRNGIFVSE